MGATVLVIMLMGSNLAVEQINFGSLALCANALQAITKELKERYEPHYFSVMCFPKE